MASNTDKAKNVLMTMATPVDVRNMTVTGGALGYVGLEVLVSYMLRRVFKIEQRGLAELTAIHGLSVPFIGGLGAFADGPDALGLEGSYGSQFMDGAKGIPAVFASTYIVNTYLQGLHLPRLNFKDILITAASKVLSRPVMSLAYPQLGETFRNGQDAIEATFEAQRAASNLNTSD